MHITFLDMYNVRKTLKAVRSSTCDVRAVLCDVVDVVRARYVPAAIGTAVSWAAPVAALAGAAVAAARLQAAAARDDVTN